METGLLEAKLRELMKVRTGIDFTDEAVRKEKLCGVKIGLPARELLLLYYDIAGELGVRLPPELVWEGKFSCYEDIAAAIAAL